jgi:hypothetical protein
MAMLRLPSVLVIDKDKSMKGISVESTSSLKKEALGNFLRMLSPHVDAIIINIIIEAWTITEERG